MRFINAALRLAAALLMTAAVAHAQSTSGTISGRVVDAQALPVPGVTINAESPNLQGIRTAVTSENGDYILSGLPSGAYKLTFDLSGFQRVERMVTLAPTQTLPVEVVLGPAAVEETVQVVGRSADVLTQTAQVALNVSQDLVQTLPTNRDINAALLLAPAVHPTGPNGGYSISGSVSFENLFMVNGVTVNENLRGQANDLYIEDAIQETTVATAGVSAELGRFSGGVVNVVTKSGGNLFTGTFRESLADDDWRSLSTYEVQSMAADTQHRDPRLNTITNERPATVPTSEYTAGGPIMKDRLWFFTAGRIQTQTEGRQLVATAIPYTFTRPTRRYEFKGTYSATSNHRFQSAYTKIIDKQQNNTFSQTASMDTNSLEDRETPQDLFTLGYTGVLTSNLFVEGTVLAAAVHVRGIGREVNRHHRRHADDRQRPRLPVLVGHLLRRVHAGAARQQQHLREGDVLPFHQRQRFTQHGVRVRQLRRRPQRQQSPVRERLSHPRHGHDCAGLGRRGRRLSGASWQ